MPRVAPGSITILVADDDPVILHVTSAILNRLGYQVLTAVDGAAALKVFEETGQPIHLLISDVVMPGMNGPQLVRAARSLSPSLATLLISGTPNTASAAGMPVLLKPFTVDALTSRVEELLTERYFTDIEREQSAARSRKVAAAGGNGKPPKSSGPDDPTRQG
jgi:CheY-like chemotaxis protein